MSRQGMLMATRVATVAVALSVAYVEMQEVSSSSLSALAFLAALALGSSVLRVREGPIAYGFETAVALPAIVVLHQTPFATLPVLVGGLCVEGYRVLQRKTSVLTALFDASRLAIVYLIAARMYVTGVDHDGSPLSQGGGALLFLIAYLAAVFFFETLIQVLTEGETRAVLEIIGSQLRLHLLMAPVLAVEVLAFQAFGLPGLAVAWVPVVLVAHALRLDAEVRTARAELDRRSGVLSVVTRGGVPDSGGDERCLTDLIQQLSGVVQMRACAVVTWEAEPDDVVVCRFGECNPSDQAILRWVDSAGWAENAPKTAILQKGSQRAFSLRGGEETWQLVLGIQTAEVIYGVLVFETDDWSISMPEMVDLFRYLVDQKALSIQDQILRQLMREKTALLEKQAETMAAILEVSSELIGQHEVDVILGRIAQSVRRSLGFDIVLIALRDPRTGEFIRRAHAGLDDIWEDVRKKRVPAHEITDFFADEFRISHSYFVSHATLRKADYDLVIRHEDPVRQDEWHALDMLIVPLLNGEELIGYFTVREPTDGKVPTLEKIRTLEVFANQAVTALQSAHQYEEIRRLTLIDSLTPAFNHRYFQEALRKELHRHQRSGHAFTLAMVDIDDFKIVNDTWGHQVGDIVLKGLVDELLTNVRDIDIVARYGGEEFAIIFPEMPAERARDAATRLRVMVAAREFRLAQIPTPVRVTISIGVAGYPADATVETDLVARADASLYEAKRRGKNLVVVWSDLEHARGESANAVSRFLA